MKGNTDMKWFQNVNSIAELRKQYRELLKRYHPDNPGGSVEITQEINREYDALFERLNREDTESQDPHYSTEENQQFKEILQKIIPFNIEIEIIGCWIWCFNCYGYKDRLKELGFRWAPKRKAWIWHADPYRRHHSKEIPLEEIREKYGAQKVRKHKAQATLADTLLS